MQLSKRIHFGPTSNSRKKNGNLKCESGPDLDCWSHIKRGGESLKGSNDKSNQNECRPLISRSLWHRSSFYQIKWKSLTTSLTELTPKKKQQRPFVNNNKHLFLFVQEDQISEFWGFLLTSTHWAHCKEPLYNNVTLSPAISKDGEM